MSVPKARSLGFHRVPPAGLAAAVLALTACLAARGQTAVQNAQDQTDYPLKHDARDRYDRVQFMNSASDQLRVAGLPKEAGIYFFPPIPPRLGAEIPLLAPRKSSLPAPGELAGFVNELFYPVLGSRLVSGDLPKSLWTRIQSYRTQKLALQDELRARIADLGGPDSKGAEETLAAFAVLQTPRIRQLEEMAETLREELRRTSVIAKLSNDVDWDEARSWRFRPVRAGSPTQEDLDRESMLLRGAAYYQAGLSVGQRDLLREAAAEVSESTDGNVSALDGNILHFSPELTRIDLPDRLPADVQARVNAYVAAKKDLVDELRDQVKDKDGLEAAERERAFAALAVQEAPRLANLEALAAEVRRSLVSIQLNAVPPPPPALSPELTERISAYRERKRVVLDKIRAMLVSVDPASDLQSWVRDGTTATVVSPTDIRGAVEDFERQQAALLAPLNGEREAIREALASYARSNPKAADGKSVNDLLRDFEDARQKQEVWAKYRDYRSAALLPGLSLEQRRLLFDAAVVELALPLPNGEKIR